MTSRSQPGHVLWPKTSAKIIFTKRSEIYKMDHNENANNGFVSNSYFIDDDLSEDFINDDDSGESDKDNATDSDNSVDDEKLVSEHAIQLLPLEVAINNKDYFDSIDTVQVAESHEIERVGIDFVDMGITRDGSKSFKEVGQGEPHQQQTRRKIKYGPKKTKCNVQEKKSKFKPSVTFGWYDMFIGVLTIALFFVDIGTDIELAVHYFRNSLWVYGGVTTGLIVGPSLVTCFLGLHWYIIDYNKEKKLMQKLEKMGKNSKTYQVPNYVWFLRFFLTLLQIGPVIRVIEYLHCGYKSRCKHLDSRERRRYHRFMLYEDVDSCLLRLFESFLEAAPQLTWQLYIVIDLKPKEDVAGTSIRALALLSSWGSLAIALTSYHKSLRNSHQEKAKMTLKSLPFYFIWRACETGGRMLCIAMFASAFRLWVFGPLVFHWAFMSCWLIMQKTSFYKNKCSEKVFNIICGYVMIFCFLNLREGQTRFRFLLFYLIFYIENFILLALWFRFTKDLGAWFHLWGFIVVLLLFVFHVTFQLLYYKFFHPTKNIKICLPCNRYVICSSICYEVQPRTDSGDNRNERLTISETVVENKIHQKGGNR